MAGSKNGTLYPSLSKSLCKKEKDPSLAMTAVAFQDHLTKSLKLNAPLPRLSKKTTKPIKNRDRKKNIKEGSSYTKQKLKAKEEFVVEVGNPDNCSLAEKLGLVQSKNILSESDWRKQKSKSNKRNDSSEPCPICKEMYIPGRQQVLLSCSHVFHRSCISSYEKLSGRKSCPICRNLHYQTRVIYEGENLTLEACATKIQAVWKMYVIRKWYLKLRTRVPPKDPKLRKVFYEDKMKSMCERFLSEAQATESEIDMLMEEVDQNIQFSRDVIKEFDYFSITDEKWNEIESKAISFGTTECPICMMPMSAGTSLVALLSCSHIFHENCLSSYETFMSKKNCPLCRENYCKKIISSNS